MTEPRIHQHLRAWRLAKGMTLEQVGGEMGVEHTTVQRWEFGKIAIPSTKLERLAALYGVSVPSLLAAPNDHRAQAVLAAQGIIESLDPEDMNDWLKSGRRLTRG